MALVQYSHQGVSTIISDLRDSICTHGIRNVECSDDDINNVLDALDAATGFLEDMQPLEEVVTE